jgi:hypothetical protein
MVDPFIDDIKALLEKEKGDELILKQICRACENNEVISNYERNYVQKMAEKYLGRPSQFEEKQHAEEKSIVSSEILPIQKITTFRTATTTQIPKLKSKNSKLLLGIFGTILAVIIIIGISLTGISHVESDNPQTSVGSTSLLIQTDLLTYQNGDIISISGKSTTSGSVVLSIENEKGQLVWSEQIYVKNDGSFSTLAIAGGVGWEKSGMFTITAKNNLETESKAFSFNI